MLQAPISLQQARDAGFELSSTEAKLCGETRIAESMREFVVADAQNVEQSFLDIVLAKTGYREFACQSPRQRRLAAAGTAEDYHEVRHRFTYPAQASCIPHKGPRMLKPIPIASNPAFRGRVITVSSEVLRYSNGREHTLDFVRHPGAAAVVAVDEADRVCFVRQYRHGIEDFMWEIPAGKLDSGEAPAVCAVRELAEETGVTARNWKPMGLYIPAPGIFTEVIHLYLARELEIGKATPDVDEELELQWLPLSDAIGRLQRGEWNDGKTAMALMRAQYHLQL